MVDEFSSFARMPSPVLKPEDLTAIVERAVFLERTAHSDIAFTTHFAARPITIRCDGRLVGQALINIVKNAVEAIEARIVESGPNPPGQLAVSVDEMAGKVVVSVEDNGKGLPKRGRERLTEPYVTTRTKGTGLGLAIVKKIMEDHQGELVLEDAEPKGARVRLVFVTEVRAAMRTDPDAAADLSEVAHGA
jgi:two-component system nitrogen regulation sensor histidine kinase NtrY